MAFDTITSSIADSACDICYATTAPVRNETELIKRENLSNFYFPGAEGNAVLNSHLRMHFIASKLLKLPQVDYFHFMNKWRNGCVVQVCNRCEVIINETVDLHIKTLEMQRKIDLLGEKLTGFRETGQYLLDVTVDNVFSGSGNRNSKVKRKSRQTRAEEPESDYYIPSDGDSGGDDFEDTLMFDQKLKAKVDSSKHQVAPVPTVNEPENIDGISAKIIPKKDDSIAVPKFRFQCTDCSMIFSTRNSLHIHTKNVHGYQMKYPCPQCPDLKFSRSELREHRKKVHDPNSSTCHKCGKKLCSKRSLNQHFRLVHKMKVTFPCPLCCKEFSKKMDLITHKNRDHVKSKTFKEPETEEERLLAQNPCLYCGRIFISANSFKYHLVKVHESKMDKKERSQDKKMKCFFCWKSFVLQQTRFIHVIQDHGLSTLEFPCEMCTLEKIVFPTTLELESHLAITHQKDDSVIHKCPKCGWPFMSEESLKAHQEVHIYRVPDPNTPGSKKSTYKFACWFCWEVYPTEEARQKHLTSARRHRNRTFEFPCDITQCEHHAQPFKNVAELNVHLAKCHLGGGGANSVIHSCSICSWGFVSKNLLTIHKLNHVHRRKGNYKCPDCDLPWRKLSTLVDHFNTTHGANLEIRKCPHCPMRFTATRGVAKHLEAMHKEKTLENGGGDSSSSMAVPCDQCGKIFKNEKVLKSHQDQQHKVKMCQDCGMEFFSSHKLFTHRKKLHMKSNDVSQHHLCGDCGKGFAYKGDLKRHMIFHGEKKFECQICEYKTWTNGFLRDHMRKHEKKAKRPPPPPPKFSCDVCGKGYARKDSLDDHVRVEHSTETHRVWSCLKCGKRFKRKGFLDAHNGSKGCSERFTNNCVVKQCIL